ncbi:MAG TPA: hypothetical protein VJ023_03010 [Pyrinomonadaceae bacterium]|nr:hypothetical protein [Pyrinomonadaceae bacterium]
MLLTKERLERNRALFILAVTAFVRSRPWQESFIDKFREELARIVSPFVDRFSDLALGSFRLSQSARARNRLMDVLALQTEFNPPGSFVPISIRALESSPFVSFVNSHSTAPPLV